jgi:hypothetical protein
MRPLTEFFPNKGGTSKYCRRHQAKRNNERRTDRIQQASAEQREAILARKRELDRLWSKHKRDTIKHRQAARKWYRKNKERVALNYQAWVERNPDRRRASQQDWLQRQRERPRRYTRPHLIPAPPD